MRGCCGRCCDCCTTFRNSPAGVLPKGKYDDKVRDLVLGRILDDGMSIERTWGVDEAFDLVRRAGPYCDLTREAFESVLHYLSGRGKVLGGYGINIVSTSKGLMSGKAARRENIGGELLAQIY